MEMDMDIPLPEELEWLESNALHEEEQEDFEELIEEDFEEVQDPKSISPENSKKRRLHPDVVVVEGVSRSSPDEKKSRTAASSPEAVPDEEWLRYSPREDPVVVDDGGGDDDPVAGVVEEKLLSRFASEINGPSISVTGPCGDRVYFMMRHDEVYGGDRRGLNVRTSSKGLLSEPMNVLMEKMEQEALNKALQASFGASNDPMDEAVPISTEKLWVEKYAPGSFTELLSDEQTNREVLLWLKQWDNCVFGSQIRATSNDVLSALKRHSSVAQQNKFSDFRILSSKSNGFPLRNQNFKLSDALNEEKNNLKELWNKKTAANGSPEQKILLLCGPPGLGKTTLAHVAAKHCGYRVVEINASDDRSSSTIESKILDVVQMDSVMADSKPKCLVIDEIDGALGEGKGAVEVILKMVASDRKSAIKVGDAAEESQPGKASLKRSSRRATLLRPVICICNDLYAPALRPLRQVAKVHIFVQPAISRVVNRLKYICNKEGFKASGIGLSALAEYTEGDIRSCLNTLQFLNKKRESLKVWDIGSQVVGRKDMSRSVFDIWKEVFQKRRVKHEVKSMNSRVPGNMDFLYSLISDRGDYDLTMEGIYENFLHLSYHDPLMQKTGKCLDFLGGSDTLLQYIMRTQHMFLYVYQPFIAIAIHSEIAQVGKPNIEWPKATQRSRAMLMEKKEILKCWHNKISPQISRHLSIASFVTDVVSLLLHVLSPSTLRPVALHLLSQREREDLAQLVDTMVSYSLTYKNMKYEPLLTNQREAVSDASMLSLDPPIEHFINFKDYQTGYCVLSSTIKQVLLHEIEKRKILRENGGQPVHPSAESNSDQPLRTKDIGAFSNKTNNTDSSIKINRENPNCAPTHESLKAGASPNSILRDNKCGTANGVKVKAPTIANRRSSSSSFFDRFRKLSSKGSEIPDDYQQKPATMERDSRPFLFKYNEGFTNAVKRPVRIRELLP